MRKLRESKHRTSFRKKLRDITTSPKPTGSIGQLGKTLSNEPAINSLFGKRSTKSVTLPKFNLPE